MSCLTEGIEKVKKGSFEAAFDLFKKGYFDENDRECACYLAQMYFDKRITPRDDYSLRKAMILWEITANKGKTSSKHKLGTNYYGSRNPVVRKKGFELITEARDEGYDVSNCVLGMIAYNSDKFDDAIEHFKKYKNIRKDEKAYCTYGECFMKKFDPDFKTAAKILVDCFETYKSIPAAELLCGIYEEGSPLADAGKFFSYARAQADLGKKAACEYIAIVMQNGEYRPSDASDSLVISYLMKADSELSAEGCSLAAEKFFHMYMNSGMQNESYYEKAKAYGERAVELDKRHAVANFNMGDIMFAKERRSEAAYYYKKAYDNGCTDACEELFTVLAGMPGHEEETHYWARTIIKNRYNVTNPYVYSCVAFNIINGNFGEKANYREAGDLFIKAAEMNDMIAMEMVGFTRVEYGETAVDTYTAMRFCEKAIEMGSVDAIYYLALIHIQCNNAAKAISLLNEAVNKGHADSAYKMAELYDAGYVSGYKEKWKAREWRKLAEKLSQE